MASRDMICLSGKVIRQERDLFTVECSLDGSDKTIEVKAKPAGKLRMNSIKILEGDMVDVEVSPYDPSKGRITYRHK